MKTVNLQKEAAIVLKVAFCTYFPGQATQRRGRRQSQILERRGQAHNPAALDRAENGIIETQVEAPSRAEQEKEDAGVFDLGHAFYHRANLLPRPRRGARTRTFTP